jgi:putative PEP-CTERM system histidine kinase
VISVAFLSNLLGSILFLILAVLLLINWRGQLLGGLLIVCSILSTLWFSSIAYNSASGNIPLIWIKIFETLRDTAWLSFLYFILKQRPDSSLSWRFKILVPSAIFGLTLIILFVTLFISQIGMVSIAGLKNISVTYMSYLLMALLGLLLVEQIYRSALPSARWAMKFLCLGIGGIFVYDFFLYSEALLFNRINPDIWYVRGAINAMCAPLIVVAVARNPQWKMELFVSRHVVYQSSATMVAGFYLILMAIGGYYIRNYGGTWGGALQIVFIFGALMLLLVLIFSEEMRVKLKVYLAEHFYKNKYDYRQEWLGITKLLAGKNNDANIYTTIVRAVTSTMNCPGGALWLIDEDNIFRKKESISFHEKIPEDIELPSGLIELTAKTHSVINIDRYKTDPGYYKHIVLPEALSSSNDVWLFIALINNDALLGFVLLTQPYSDMSFGAEDVDLLKTVGNQIASYIALLKVTEDLAQARQFEVFNRLSAFVVHDIKNIVAQLSLINTNALKHRHEPEFIDDVFSTIDNSVTKMKRLLSNLRKQEILGTQLKQQVNIAELVNEVIKMRSIEKPAPVAKHIGPGLILNIEKDKLLSVLEHIVQNAQEATADQGKVEIAALELENEIQIKVSDTGTGMDIDFVRNRLFKPFVTTKGNAGMGIGVYESREVINAMGGNLRVDSEVGKGTVFTLCLPNLNVDTDTSEEFGRSSA